MAFPTVSPVFRDQIVSDPFLPRQTVRTDEQDSRARQLYFQSEEAYGSGNSIKAFLYCREAAKDGSIEAIRTLGCHYLRNSQYVQGSYTVSLKQSLACLRRSVVLGDFVAMRLLADLYNKGICDEICHASVLPSLYGVREEGKVRLLYQLSADHGSSTAMCRLGLLCLNAYEKWKLFQIDINHPGITLETQHEIFKTFKLMRQQSTASVDNTKGRSEAVQARLWFQKAAEKKNPEGMILFRSMLVHDIGGGKDKKIIALLDQKITNLAHCHIIDTSASPIQRLCKKARLYEELDNLSGAMVLYHQAANLGSSEACLRLRGIYEQNTRESALICSEPFRSFSHKSFSLKSADDLIDEVDSLLKKIREDCTIENSTFSSIREWFRQHSHLACKIRTLLQQATALGSLLALDHLGRLLYDGFFNDLEKDAGLQMIHQAAEYGYIPSLYTLAQIYGARAAATGSIVDKQKAISFMYKAALEGDVVAIHTLSDLHLKGRDVPKDRRYAHALLQLSANCGDLRACVSIANWGKDQLSCYSFIPWWQRRMALPIP